MAKAFKSLIEVSEHFKNDRDCSQWFAGLRWGDIVCCPHCASVKTYLFSNGIKYKCGDCFKQFTVKVGTIFEDSKVSLKKWIMAYYLLMAHKKGISSHQLAKDIHVTQKTAWFMLQRLRWALNQGSIEKLKGVVESDETFVGGKNKNRHKAKKLPMSNGRTHQGKTPVLGLLQRSETGAVTVVTKVVSDTSPRVIQPLLHEYLDPSAILISDEWCAYAQMSKHFMHFQIDHSKGQYAQGHITTNRIEGYWSQLKRTLLGTYHNVTPRHLQRYCDESTFRFNTKDMTDGERFILAMEKTVGKRLTYKTLIGKA